MVPSLASKAARVGHDAANRGCSGGCGACEVGACSRSLSAFEIAVGSGNAASTGRKAIIVDGRAHRAAWLAPFEAGIGEDAMQTECFGLPLDSHGARHNHRAHMACNFSPPH